MDDIRRKIIISESSTIKQLFLRLSKMVQRNTKREIARVSNEVELSLSGVSASRFVGIGGITTGHEVNERDVIELKVCMRNGIADLNRSLDRDLERLNRAVELEGGSLYGGGAVLADLSKLEPRRFLTTSISERCARNFLGITSQQIVMGVKDEAFGFELYNMFRRMSPVLLALSASSPFEYLESSLRDTGQHSNRMHKYRELMGIFPERMLESPSINTHDEYFERLYIISSDVRIRLDAGILDANFEELVKERKNGERVYRYYPFESLEPHQIFWFTRPRPDFRNEESKFVLEIRTPDTPIRIERMKAVNALILGLSYYIGDYGDTLNIPFDGTLREMFIAGREGVGAVIGRNSVVDVAEGLVSAAQRGLRNKGYEEEARRLKEMLNIIYNGNDAEEIRAYATESEGRTERVVSKLASVLRR